MTNSNIYVLLSRSFVLLLSNPWSEFLLDGEYIVLKAPLCTKVKVYWPSTYLKTLGLSKRGVPTDFVRLLYGPFKMEIFTVILKNLH